MGWSARAAPARSTIGKAILGILPRGMRITGGAIALEGRDLLTLTHAVRAGRARRRGRADPAGPADRAQPGRRIGAQMTDGLRLWRGLSAQGGR